MSIIDALLLFLYLLGVALGYCYAKELLPFQPNGLWGKDRKEQP
jgi:hypothetical protein